MSETTMTTRPMSGMRWPIAAACTLVVGSVLAVGAFRASGVSIATPDAPASASRELRFLDRPDGSIAVVDSRNGRVVETVVGENGFIRGTLRGLARERRREGIGPERPFQLVAHVDGRLTLIDPATQRRVDLESFGPTNAGAFAHMLQSAVDDGRPRS